MSSVTGSQTCTASPLPHCTSITTTAAIQVSPCKRVRLKWLGQSTTIHRTVSIRRKTRGIYWFTISVRERERRFSQHACRDYWRPLLPEQVSREVSTDGEKKNKRKYLKACLWNLYHFSPFFVSADGLISVEEEAKLKYIDIWLATNWKQSYYRMCGNIKSRMAITLVRVTHCCIWGSQIPVCISVKQPQWQNGASLHLF